MSRYIVLDLEELKKSPYIVIDLSNIGETSPQLTQVRLIREVTHTTAPYIVIDLEDIDKHPYIVIDLEDIDDKIPESVEIKLIRDVYGAQTPNSAQIILKRNIYNNQSTNIDLIREVYDGFIPNNAQIDLIRDVFNKQSTNIDLIREIENGLTFNSTQIDLKRIVLNEQSTNIALIRDVIDSYAVFNFSFAGVGQIEKPGITLDIQCCCITHKNEIIAKITEEKPLYVENTELTIKPFVFLLIKPVNGAGISYDDVSTTVSYYEYSVLPLFPDRSNKGYKET